MNFTEWDIAYNSLLSCMVGLISTIDLHDIKRTIDSYPDKILTEYYEKAIEDHSKMSIYHNPYEM